MNDANHNVNFSILMPVYNKEKPAFFKSALESIYDSQTLKPDEIIILFDGKLTDDLYRVIDEFMLSKENVVKTVSFDEKVGLGAALREGCRHCHGEYIFRMDSDDVSVRDRFEKQLAYAKSHPELDAVGGIIAEFESDPNRCYRIRECPASLDGIRKMSRTRNPMNHVSVCIKRSSLDKCGGYEPLPQLEDYFLWLKMLNAGLKLGNMPDVLVKVRVGSGFIKRRGSKKLVSGWLKLQRYMIVNHMINIPKAVLNMAYIIGFTVFPTPFRRLVYDKIMRKNCRK